MCVQELKNVSKIFFEELIYLLNLSKERPVKLKTQDIVFLIVRKLAVNLILNGLRCVEIKRPSFEGLF